MFLDVFGTFILYSSEYDGYIITHELHLIHMLDITSILHDPIWAGNHQV